MAEAFGVVCAIVPVILAVAEHYGEAAAAFSCHRMFVSEAANIASTLKIQRLIFRAANRTLLGRCVGEELAAQMLDNARHPLWTDRNLEIKLRQRLGDSVDAMAEAVKLIEDQLQRLDKHRQTLERAEFDAKKRGHGGTKPTSKQKLKRLKCAYAEGPFQKIIDCLRDLNQDFRVLIEQRAAVADRRKSDSKLSSAINKSIVNFRLVQAAAKDLYTALSLACTQQSEYQVYLAIQSSQNTSSPEFRVGIDSQNLRPRYDDNLYDFWWVSFRSITTSDQSNALLDAAALTGLVDSVKRKSFHDGPPGQNETKRAKKCVRFKSATPPPMAAEQHGETSPEPRRVVSDLFGLLQSSRGLSKPETTHCDGSPAYAAQSKFLCSLDLREDVIPRDSQGRSSTFISLASLFARPENMKKGARLSFFHRVRLARLLATALLRLHATPWLKSTLCSRDIFLYSVESSVINTISVREEVYLKTSIRGADCASLEKSPALGRPLVRNADTFALGVILIELAFEAPLHSLQRPTDVSLHEDQNTDYYIADRVRWTVSRMLGPRYADLVTKCIHCDFGRGDDLTDIRLQESFYVEVVQELEDLEARFHDVGLGN